MERLGAQIDAIGPDDGAGLSIDLDCSEEVRVLEILKNAAPANDPVSQVYFPRDSIGKAQTKTVIGKMLNGSDAADLRHLRSLVTKAVYGRLAEEAIFHGF
jgi:hypothetical protein